MKSDKGTSIAWSEQLSRPHWYVVRTNPHQESLARMSLKAEGFEAYLPLLPKLNRRKETHAVPLFPGFLFVRLELGSEGWTRVFSTRGVSSILGNGVRPSPLAEVFIHNIQRREHEAFVAMGLAPQTPEIKPSRQFEEGEKVVVRLGVFTEIEATFVKKMVDAERCEVLIRMLGESPRLARVALAHIK